MAASLFQRRIGAATDTHIAVARFEGADETGKLPPYVSAMLSFAVARCGIAEETVVASRNASALLNFAPHLVGAAIGRPIATVLLAPTGRADAVCVSAIIHY